MVRYRGWRCVNQQQQQTTVVQRYDRPFVGVGIRGTVGHLADCWGHPPITLRTAHEFNKTSSTDGVDDGPNAVQLSVKIYPGERSCYRNPSQIRVTVRDHGVEGVFCRLEVTLSFSNFDPASGTPTLCVAEDLQTILVTDLVLFAPLPPADWPY